MSTNIKYVVNPEKKTVVCFLKGCKQDIQKALSKNERMIVWDLGIDCTLKDKYIGIAKCTQEDTFDEEYGRQLARKRMLRQYYKDKAEVYRTIYKKVNDTADSFYKRYSNYSAKETHKYNDIINQINNDDYIDKLIEA